MRALSLLLLMVITSCSSFDDDVRLPPSFTDVTSGEIMFTVNTTVTMSCQVIGVPRPNVTWYKDGTELDADAYPDNVFHELSSNLLVVHPAAMDDANTTYNCVAVNLWGVVIGPKVVLRLAYLEQFLEQSESSTSNYTVEEGSDLVIRCIGAAVSVPRGLFGWIISEEYAGSNFTDEDVVDDFKEIASYHGNVSKKSHDRCWSRVELNDRIQIDDDGNLHLANVRSSDAYVGRLLKCVVTNIYLNTSVNGSTSIITVNTTVNTTNSTFVPPRIAFTSNTTTVVLIGNQVTLTCFYYGFPTPRVSWSMRHGKHALREPRYQLSQRGTRLTIDNVQPSDEGIYVCTGTSLSGSSNNSINVVVKGSPSFPSLKRRPHNINATQGDNVSFVCDPSAQPPATIEWSMNGAPLDVSNLPIGYSLSADGRNFTISNVCKNCPNHSSDFMVVQCTATNPYGSVTAEGYLNVLKHTTIVYGPQDVSYVDGDVVRITCRARSDHRTNITIFWLHNGIPLLLGHPRANLYQVSQITDDDSTLTINSYQAATVVAGTYTCLAWNGYSLAVASAFVVMEVAIPVKDDTTPEPTDVPSEGNATLPTTTSASTISTSPEAASSSTTVSSESNTSPTTPGSSVNPSSSLGQASETTTLVTETSTTLAASQSVELQSLQPTDSSSSIIPSELQSTTTTVQSTMVSGSSSTGLTTPTSATPTSQSFPDSSPENNSSVVVFDSSTTTILPSESTPTTSVTTGEQTTTLTVPAIVVSTTTSATLTTSATGGASFQSTTYTLVDSSSNGTATTNTSSQSTGSSTSTTGPSSEQSTTPAVATQPLIDTSSSTTGAVPTVTSSLAAGSTTTSAVTASPNVTQGTGEPSTSSPIILPTTSTPSSSVVGSSESSSSAIATTTTTSSSSKDELRGSNTSTTMKPSTTTSPLSDESTTNSIQITSPSSGMAISTSVTGTTATTITSAANMTSSITMTNGVSDLTTSAGFSTRRSIFGMLWDRLHLRRVTSSTISSTSYIPTNSDPSMTTESSVTLATNTFDSSTTTTISPERINDVIFWLLPPRLRAHFIRSNMQSTSSSTTGYFTTTTESLPETSTPRTRRFGSRLEQLVDNVADRRNDRLETTTIPAYSANTTTVAAASSSNNDTGSNTTNSGTTTTSYATVTTTAPAARRHPLGDRLVDLRDDAKEKRQETASAENASVYSSAGVATTTTTSPQWKRQRRPRERLNEKRNSRAYNVVSTTTTVDPGDVVSSSGATDSVSETYPTVQPSQNYTAVVNPTTTSPFLTTRMGLLNRLRNRKNRNERNFGRSSSSTSTNVVVPTTLSDDSSVTNYSSTITSVDGETSTTIGSMSATTQRGRLRERIAQRRPVLKRREQTTTQDSETMSTTATTTTPSSTNATGSTTSTSDDKTPPTTVPSDATSTSAGRTTSTTVAGDPTSTSAGITPTTTALPNSSSDMLSPLLSSSSSEAS